MTVWSPTELQFIQEESLASTTQKSPRKKHFAFRVISSEFSFIYLFEYYGKYSPFQRKPPPDQLHKRKALILCLSLIPITAPQLLLSPFTLSPKATSHLIRLFPEVHVQSSCYFTCFCSKQHCSLSSPSVKCGFWCYHCLKLYLLSFKPFLFCWLFLPVSTSPLPDSTLSLFSPSFTKHSWNVYWVPTYLTLLKWWHLFTMMFPGATPPWLLLTKVTV